MNNLKTPHIEALKELLRLIVIAVIPVLILSLESGWSWKVTGMTAAIVVLRSLEKFMHEWNKLSTTERKLPELPL